MAVLPGSVFIERSFLPDGAMTALMTTSLWMLVAWCQTDKASYLVLATLTGALGCLTKLPGGILLIPAVYILISLCEPKLRKSQFRIRVIAAATTVVGLVGAYYLWARHVALTYPPFHFKGEGKFLWNDGVSVWLAQDWFIPDLWDLLVGPGGLWGYPFFILAGIGLIVPFPMALKSKHGIWLFHFFLLALLVRFFLEAEHLAKDPYNLHLYNIAAAAFGGHALVKAGSMFARAVSVKASIAPVTAVLAISAIFGQFNIRKLSSDHYADHYALGRQIRELSASSDLVVTFGAEPVVLYHSGHLGWVFPPADGWITGGAWDYGHNDLAQLDTLISHGAAYVAIPSWNSYTGGSGKNFLLTHYPALYAGLVSRLDLVSDEAHGAIYRANRSRQAGSAQVVSE